jgi:hypothetical protein
MPRSGTSTNFLPKDVVDSESETGTVRVGNVILYPPLALRLVIYGQGVRIARFGYFEAIPGRF